MDILFLINLLVVGVIVLSLVRLYYCQRSGSCSNGED